MAAFFRTLAFSLLGAGVLLSGCGTSGVVVNSTSPTSTPNPPASTSTDFWDAGNIPAAKNVMIFKFLNRTNGQYPDSQVFWSVTINGVTTAHSIAEQQYFDMPANSSGRIYFYLGALNSKYYDFIEYTIGPARFNGNTTRVDAFGIKLAFRLHCADGYEATVGEDAATFAEDRATTFQRFINEVPAEFKHLAQIQAPYRIVRPSDGEFKTGGLYEHYYDAYVNEIWQSNGLTIAKPGPSGDENLGAFPDLSAAIYRHTAGPGTFSPAGKLLDQAMWASSAAFYQTAPANYYAKFWHDHALNGKAYGFPYDDAGGYSSFIAHDNPQYALVAIGW